MTTRQITLDIPDNVLLVEKTDEASKESPMISNPSRYLPSTLDRVAQMGISYNRFRSTAMCSPTRASLLIGRNHTRVSNGQIAANLHQSRTLAILRYTLPPKLLSGKLSVSRVSA
jgi:arylsulfatase A-like enzyme